ncbi:MAG: rod shape-determining protein RodA [Alphaproteobacteria bacterium]|nr:rod shape-determining protein RodA [Alphaproteobacteria bacterium]MCR4555218.1 rod shape-determining protein RodA [Alphaproteobacteria bacterium]
MPNKVVLKEIKIFLLLLATIILTSILGQIIAFGGVEIQVKKHIIKMIFGLAILFVISRVNVRFWKSFAFLIYVLNLFCLLLVCFLGATKLGAQRWIDFYFFSFQPSEFMKLSLIFAIASYYSDLSEYEFKELKSHLFPFVLTIVPAIIILKQPDLGTAMLLSGVGVGMIFLAGFPTKAFIWSAIGFLGVCPIGWYFLRDYQKNRILNFIDPDRDPLGTGYHILQSRIAIGSGHIFGKGLFRGTQSSLNFLPEKHTDFIFTTISEELGFVGSAFIIFLFAGMTYFFFYIGNGSKSRFSRYLCFGLGLILFLHVFINIGMVLGILPVVGVPLPFLSYGGSSLITFMISCGLMMSILLRVKV